MSLIRPVSRLIPVGALALAAACAAPAPSAPTAGPKVQSTPPAASAAAAPTGAPTARPAAAPAEKVTVQLAWLKNVQFAGIFMALEKGFYAAENLEVETLAAGGQIGPLQVVLGGAAQIGIIGGAVPLIAGRARSADVRVIGATHQKSPGALTCMPTANVRSAADLVGKRLGAAPPQRPGLETLLRVNGIAVDQVEIVTTGADLTPLTSGRVDCRMTYATDEPIALRRQGIEPTVLLSYDLGVRQQGDSIFVTAETLATRSDMLVRWLRATMRGWEYAIANVEETADVVLTKFGENLDREQQVEALKALATLIDTPYSREHGLLAIDPSTWQFTARTMHEQGQLDGPFDVESLLAPQIHEHAREGAR